jgi:colanic acid biosynthesis glycosyl transferase WcaI
MKFVISSMVCPPEAHPSAVMVAQLGSYLADRGHGVTVAAGYPHHPLGRLHKGWKKKLVTDEVENGIRVVRAWHITLNSRKIWARALVMISQALAMGVSTLWAGPCDVVINYGPPLIGPIIASLVALCRGANLVTVIYDLYPDIAAETGKVRNPLVLGLARIAERLVYRVSDNLIVLSDGFRETLVKKGVPERKITVIPVWLDADEIHPSPSDTELRRAHGIGPEIRVALYAGTIGIVSGAEMVLDVAEQMSAEKNLLFLFVGEGEIKEHLQAEAARRRLFNVRFLPLQPRYLINQVQASADISLVTLSAGRGRTSVPSKVVGYLAAGRPVVASVDLDSDTARCINTASCGKVVPPGSASIMASAIQDLLSNEGSRLAMGLAARTAFEKHYAAPAVLAAYASNLESVPG